LSVVWGVRLVCVCVVSWCDCVRELWEGEICGIGVK
jgi:hypothetical protein